MWSPHINSQKIFQKVNFCHFLVKLLNFCSSTQKNKKCAKMWNLTKKWQKFHIFAHFLFFCVELQKFRSFTKKWQKFTFWKIFCELVWCDQVFDDKDEKSMKKYHHINSQKMFDISKKRGKREKEGESLRYYWNLSWSYQFTENFPKSEFLPLFSETSKFL